MKSPKPATDNSLNEHFALWQILSLIQDIIIYLNMKFRWNRTMLNLCGIVASILKMATGRNCALSGINSGHHYLPTYQMLMISDNVEFLPPIFMPCFGSHFKNGRHLEILKTQNYSSDGDLSLCQNLCLYHYPIRSYQH
jgi:hypothetical protein